MLAWMADASDVIGAEKWELHEAVGQGDVVCMDTGMEH